jgi:hypothetical protein
MASIAGVLLVVTGGAAFAYWRTVGSGSGSGATTTLVSPSVVALTGGDAPTTSLLPGTSSDVVLRVSNPNSFSVTLTAITLNGSITAAGGLGTCATTGVTANFPSSPSIAVAAGSHLIDLPGAAAMSLASDNGCQGATFHLPVSLTFTR